MGDENIRKWVAAYQIMDRVRIAPNDTWQLADTQVLRSTTKYYNSTMLTYRRNNAQYFWPTSVLYMSQPGQLEPKTGLIT